jgi:NADPH:quinone reductase-like Zn-dependent oxidoreductase
MKAIIYKKYGSPEVLELVEMTKPIPQNKEVLVKVMATAVNRTDCAILTGKPFIMRLFTGILEPTKQVQGTEFSGEIEAVGSEVLNLKVGDRVFGFDDTGLKAHAGYLLISEDGPIAEMPGNVDFNHAAAVEGAHYAINFLNKVNIQPGERVLVNGAAGGIGSAMVQLLKYQGAHVTATCDTKNIDLLSAIGADKVIDYTAVDFTKSNQQFDYVFDAAGKSSFTKCKPLLKPGGVYISSELGEHCSNLFLALWTPLLRNKKVVFPIPFNCKKSVLFIKKLTEEGKFKAVIDREYTLENIAEAYTYVAKGFKSGNVIVTLNAN